MTILNSTPSRMAWSVPMIGANGGTTFFDAKGRTVFVTGSVTTTTAQSTVGLGSSGSFPGGSNYLSLSLNSDYDFGSGPFRLRAFVRPANVTGLKIISTNRATTGSDPGFIFFLNGAQVQFLCYGPSAGTILANIATTTNPMVANTWAEVEALRIGNVFSINVNGTQLVSTTASGAIVPSGNPLYIGRDPSVVGREFSGNICLCQGFKGGYI